MGDIWPCGPPAYATWQEAYNMIYFFTKDPTKSQIMAAIAEAESSLDLSVINDTPSTGDYSVGAWQINYYAGLYASRTAAFGTPCQLVAGGLGLQARAALAIQGGGGGYNNWTTYTSGAYKQFLHGAQAPGPVPSAGPSPWLPGFQDGLAAYYTGQIEPAGVAWRAHAQYLQRFIVPVPGRLA